MSFSAGTRHSFLAAQLEQSDGLPAEARSMLARIRQADEEAAAVHPALMAARKEYLVLHSCASVGHAAVAGQCSAHGERVMCASAV